MKHVKLYENKVLDDILDKISDKGYDSLTTIEKEYMDNYDSDKGEDIKSQIETGKDNYETGKEYDPRDDKEFFAELGIDFSNWTDEQIEDGRYLLMWDELRDEDMEEFVHVNGYPIDIAKQPWDNLHISIRTKFKNYIDDSGMLI
jgi:uncharacterized protein DUF6576